MAVSSPDPKPQPAKPSPQTVLDLPNHHPDHLPKMGRFNFFCKRTTLHGFREFRDSSRWWQKSVWILLISLCTSCFILQTREQVLQLLDGSKAASLSTLTAEKYPLPKIYISVKNWYWLDQKKIDFFNLSYEDLQIAKSYLTNDIDYDSKIPVDLAKEKLQEKLFELNTTHILDFFKNLALDVFDGSENLNAVSDRFILDDRAYYVLNTETGVFVKSEISETLALRVKFNFTSYASRVQTLAGSEVSEIGRFASFGDLLRNKRRPILINSDLRQHVVLRPGFKYNIHTTVRLHRRISNCVPADYGDMRHAFAPKSCLISCDLAGDGLVNATSCFQYNISVYLLGDLLPRFSYCSYGLRLNGSARPQGMDVPIFKNLSQSEMRARSSYIDQCKVRCQPPCEQWMSTMTAMVFESDVGDISHLDIYFPDASAVMATEEVYQYLWHDLISDVGGLLGLWLGASMMSIFQTLHLCFCSRRRVLHMGVY